MTMVRAATPPTLEPVGSIAGNGALADTVAPPARRRSGRRWLLIFGEALLAGVVAGFVLLVLAPVAIGWRPYTVLTGSMRPIIQPGDVVMDRPIPISEAHVGEVVTFSDPTRQGKLVTHRIRSITPGPVDTAVETRGDANDTSERWSVKTKDRVGKVVYVIPKVGHAANAIRNPTGIFGLVVLPVLGLGLITIRKIWTEDDEDDQGPDPEGGDDADPDAGAESSTTEADSASDR